MNLKEEIKKEVKTVPHINGGKPITTKYILTEDAERIAREYAKEMAWEAWKFTMKDHGHWPGNWDAFEQKQYTFFEKWYSEQSKTEQP